MAPQRWIREDWRSGDDVHVGVRTSLLREVGLGGGLRAGDVVRDADHLIDEIRLEAKGMRIFAEKMAEAIESFVPAGPGDASVGHGGQ